MLTDNSVVSHVATCITCGQDKTVCCDNGYEEHVPVGTEAVQVFAMLHGRTELEFERQCANLWQQFGMAILRYNAPERLGEIFDLTIWPDESVPRARG